LKRFGLQGDAYHTISATRGRQPFFSDATMSGRLLESIQFVRHAGAAFVLAYAIMLDHLHLLLVPRDNSSVSDVMKSVKGYTAKDVNKLMRRSGPIWQPSFYDRVIRGEQQLSSTIEYIHRNPVVAGLVGNAEAYAFSSASPNAETDLEAFLSQ
jgi:putative transposase